MISLVVQVPVHKNTNACKADIHPHNHITEEDPGCDETVVGTMGELLHYVEICGVESQCYCGGAVGDEVHPQELDGENPSGMPRAAVKNVAATLPIFEDIQYLMKACILLQINRPCLMI